MSIILQIGAPHVSCVAPVKCTEAIMGAGSEPKSMEAPIIPEECNIPQPSATTGYSNCFGLPYQDHNYGAPPPPTPPQSPAKLNGPLDEDTSTSVVTTSTTNEEDAAEEESITRCICEFDHDDEYMICCDKCSVWQHVDCMGLDRNNIPETYMCEKCEPRKVDRQKAKALQTKKREEMTDSSSDESGDENSQFKNSPPHSTSTSATTKGKKIRRKMRDKLEEKIPVTPTKKLKRGKDKTEPRKVQTKKRRKSKSSEVAHIDEDARDSWDSTVLDYKQTYEEAETNQYSPEVHLQLTNLKLNGQHEEFVRKVSEHLRMTLCRVAEINKVGLAVFAIEDILPNQIVCEYRGKFLLVSQFQQQNPVFNNKFHQYVLFYSFHKDQEDVCVDSREYGNDARFIRRSCSPNAEVRHVVENGSLHLYIVSISEIKQDEEITIPFDFNYENCIDKVECPCLKTSCPVNSLHKKNGQIDNSIQEKKCKKVKKVSVVDEESTTYSSSLCSTSVIKAHKMSPLRLSQSNNQPQVATSPEENAVRSDNGLLAEVDNGNPATPSSVEIETEEQAAERRKKMTREERKMEAIMKAFARLEKAQQRRQEALARLAHKKEEQEQKRKEEEEKKKDNVEPSLDDVKQESESVNCVNGHSTTDGSSNSNGGVETLPINEDLKVVVKPKGKGKKRKNSGNQLRRRTRMNSGGSDILSPDESTQNILILVPTSCSTPTPASTPTPPAFVPSTPVPPSSPSPSDSTAVCGSSNSVNCMNFKFPKTKKLLMTEWLSEKTIEPIIQPLTIKTEPSEFNTASPTCYMRSARSPTGINTAHLRRSSGGSNFSGSKQAQTDSSLGSAKKRWLRQAMCEEVSSGEQPLPLPNGAMSPTHECNSPSTSPPVAPDLVTPLKKRRLARESMSSDTTFPSTPPSTPSPSIGGVNDLVGGDGTNMLGDPEDEEAQLERNSIDTALPNTMEETSGPKANIPEDNVYGKAIAFLQKIPQHCSLAKSLESLQDYFKKDSGVVSSPLVEKSSANEVTERDSLDVVYNTNIAMESQEHLTQTPVNLSSAPGASSTESEENGTISSSCGESVCKNIDSDKVRLDMADVTDMKPCSSNNIDQIDQNVLNNSETVECSGSEDLLSLTSKEDNVKTCEKSVGRDALTTESKVDSNNLTERNNVISLALVDSSTSEKNERDNAKVSSTVENQKDISTSGKTLRQNQTEISDKNTKENQKDSQTKTASSISELHSVSTKLEEDGQNKTVESSSSVPQTESKPDSSTSSISSSSSSSSTCLNQQSTENKSCLSNNEALSYCYQSVSSSPITSSLSLSPSDTKTVSVLSSISETSSDSDVSNSQITSTYSVNGVLSSSPPTQNTNVQNTTTKRKVSLLEYRKRKLEGQSGKSSATSTSTTTISSTLVTSPNEVPRELNPPPRLSTLPLFESTNSVDSLKNDENNQKRDAKMNLKEDVRWNSAPTTLEQQRENLTQRLKREFGLITDEDSDSEKDKIAAQELKRSNRTVPPPPPLTIKGKGYLPPTPVGTLTEGVEDGFVRTQNGRPIGCYPSHPPNPQQPLVRKGNPAVVRNIPTIIGITGFQSQSRPLPPSQTVPGVQTALPPHPQQYTYQQFNAHTTNYPAHPQGNQQTLPPPQYASPQIVTQYNGPPPPMTPQGQPRPSLSMRPPLTSPSPCSIVPALVVPPATQPPPLSHVQQQTLIRPSRPPLIQSFTETQHRYSAPLPRPQTYYNQSYYPQ